MKFNTIASLLFAASGLVSAAPLEARQDTCPVGDWNWVITKFVGRKPEGTYYNMISFHVLSTNPGSSLDFNCVATADKIQDGVFIPCSGSDSFSFAFVNEYSGLILRYGDQNPITGTTTIPVICRVGGAGPNDQVCEGVHDSCISLLSHPGN